LVLLLEDLGDLVLLEDLGDLVLLGTLVLLCVGILLEFFNCPPRNGTLLEFSTFCWKPSFEITILEIILGSDNAEV